MEWDYLENKNNIYPLSLNMKTAVDELETGNHNCFYCNIFSEINLNCKLENANNNDNSVTVKVDPFCFFSKNMDKVGDKAVIAYIPNISRVDIVHLQRSVFIALRSGDKERREKGKNIQNWLISHDKYVREFFGTSDIQQFVKAIAYIVNNLKEGELLAGFFQGLHVIFTDYSLFNEYEASVKDNFSNFPIEKWNVFFNSK